MMDQDTIPTLIKIAEKAVEEPVIVFMALLVLACTIGVLTAFRKLGDETKSDRIAATQGPPTNSQFRPL